MTLLKKELKSGLKGFLIWTGAIAFMLVICVIMFPEMKDEMADVSDIFGNMGGFTEAFGMDKLNFGSLIGFYGVECGNILGIGGGFYAAFIGISMLAKEEKEHTAEFLLTQPISRLNVLTQKLTAIFTEITSMNVLVFLFGMASIFAIGEKVPFKELILIHFAFYILALEIGFITFGISAFLTHSSVGIGLGFAALLYFMNIISNISDNASFLKYITPFSYAEPSKIINDLSLDGKLILIGVLYTLIILFFGFYKYIKKDIRA